ncbi:hypothetical protein Patl1_15486 [Pistacia atlantica]|uniref:Uncharacterized protein n=1 Tax=Pistacia atlantica TaxID=434234 RepID=A0ACC1B5H8_9ROSI|nr:hypothetical protein Patl1_15486 [Pistacia atlantica]
MGTRILRASNRQHAHIGEVIVAVRKELTAPNMPLQIAVVIRVVILRIYGDVTIL